MNKTKYITIFFLLIISLSQVYNLASTTQESNNPITINNSLIQVNSDKHNFMKINEDLNSFIDEPEPNVHLTDEAFMGKNLFILRKENKTDSSKTEHYLLITDMEGNILSKHYVGQFHSLDYLNTEFINASTIIYGTAHETGGFDGFTLWNLDTNQEKSINIHGHHDVDYNPNTNTFFTLQFYTATINGEKYVYDKIVEFDETGSIIWTFDTQPLLSHEINVFGDIYVSGDSTMKDVTHSNTVFYDADDDVIYLNSRNGNTFWKINHGTKQVEWGLGEHGNFTMYNKNGDKADSLFYNAHAVEKIAKDRFILFDNDRHNKTDLNSRNSRLLEIKINETSMTANVVWKWTAPEEYYSKIWGDADRLPNGNRLGVFGTMNHPKSNVGARLVEVNEEGNIVWEMNFPNSNNFRYGIYRMERFRRSPIIQYCNKSNNIELLTNESISLIWNATYNHRNKQTILGRYELYRNQTLIENTTFSYPKFWHSTVIETDLCTKNLTQGFYHLEIRIFDEKNHYTSQKVNITIAPYFINREGAKFIEKGQIDSDIVWSGKTVFNLYYELKINENTLISDTWSGRTIFFDLNSLNIGTYTLSLVMYNQSNLVFNDTFIARIYPLKNPVINDFPHDQRYNWNETVKLSWSIFDHQPKYFVMTINDSVNKKDWNTPNKTIEWIVPTKNEGKFLVNFTAVDINDLKTMKTFKLEIKAPTTPILIDYSQNITLKWGSSCRINWEVHGADAWVLKRNQSKFKAGNITNYKINFILKWQKDLWKPETYILVLELMSDTQVKQYQFVFKIHLEYGNPYADQIVYYNSIYYSYGEKALGKPNGEYAIIGAGYQNGYITLDMGENEEIIDGPGTDFEVIAMGGTYLITIIDNEELSKSLGEFTGNSSIDISSSNMDLIRYIRIKYKVGSEIMLDGIKAFNFNILDFKNEIPQIKGTNDFTIPYNQKYLNISWITESSVPWNYSVIVNHKCIQTSPWSNQTIKFLYKWKTVKTYNVTLVVRSLFGKTNSDTVMFFIEISTRFDILLVSMGGLFIFMALTIIYVIYLKQKLPT